MAISNTNILIKRSSSTRTPSSLQAGEFGYSYASNTLFLGNASGTGVVNVGGLFYTQTLDAATSANTANTLVIRDANKAFYGRLYGNANTATVLETARNFSITGGDITAVQQSFDGSGNVVLNASLNTVPGLTAGYYGGATQSTSTIPVVQVSANGRIMSISNTQVTSSFQVSDGTTSNTIYSGATVYYKGTTGITTEVSSNTITFGTDNTVVRSNTSGGPQTIGSDVYISGNLVVSGTQTTVYSNVVKTGDSLIQLAANNTVGDVVDIGFIGTYNNGSGSKATGLVRDAGNKSYYLFSGVDQSAITDANTVANNLFTTANTATLYSNLNAPTVTVTTLTASTANVTNDFGVTGNQYVTGNQVVTGTTRLTGTANTTNDLGVGGNFYLTGSSVIGTNLSVTGTTTLTGTANTTNDLGVGGNIYGANSVIASRGVYSKGVFAGTYTDGIVVDYSTGQGRISVGSADGIGFYTGGPAATPLMNVSSSGVITTATWQGNTVQVPYGGTGQTTFSSGVILIGNGTGAIQQLANVASINTNLVSNNTVSNLTTDVYGRVTSFSQQAISGLQVNQGGTGLNTITTNGITYGNGTGAVGVTSAAGIADQTWSNQILTVTNSGVPVWSSAMDGGQF